MPPAVAAAAIPAAISAGAGVGTAVIGSRAQSGAARRAANMQSRSDAEMIALERERDAEARRQWEAQQAFEAQKWQAQEEERAYTRRLQEEQEARMAPYRAIGTAALGSLGQMLGFQAPPMPPPSARGGPAMSPSAPVPTTRPMASSPMNAVPTGTIGQMTGLRSRRQLPYDVRM